MKISNDMRIFQSLLSERKRYVVSSRNCGFGDNLFALAHAWLYCRKTGRHLIVDLCQSRYLDQATTNAGHVFFQFPEQLDGVQILNLPEISWPLRRLLHMKRWAAWIYSNLPSLAPYLDKICEKAPSILPSFIGTIDVGEERERHMVKNGTPVPARFPRFVGCHCDHIDEIKPFLLATQPRKEIQAHIDSFLSTLPQRFIGLHVRYYSEKWVPFPRFGDYWADFEGSIERICNMVRRARSDAWSGCKVLLCTNDCHVQRVLQQRIEGVVCYKTEFGEQPEKEIFDQGISSGGHDAIIEMFALARCDLLIRFPPTNSWFSEVAAMRVPHVLHET